MSSLPFEILSHAFSYLDTTDLLQCQLTNKNWYAASVELLYTKVKIGLDYTCYVRTISNNPRLGGYLKEIDTGMAFSKLTNGDIWNGYNLMDALSRYCPNVLKLQSRAQEAPPEFWTQISYFRNQGEFSRLQCLPEYNSNDLEDYVYTVLLFKRSLTDLKIRSYYTKSLGLELNKLAVYQKLLDELSSFSNLQSLSFEYQSIYPLSYFDGLIEDCQHLTKLKFNVFSSNLDRARIEPGAIINPRRDIRELVCDWRMINDEYELNYLMQKFPSLQSIKIDSHHRRAILKNCSKHVVSELIRYIITIPSLDVTLLLRQDDFTEACMELTNRKDIWKTGTFEYHDDHDRNRDKVMLSFSDKRRFAIIFFSGEPEAGIEFMSRFGHIIRSFALHTIRLDVGSDWLVKILEPCSSLQELSLNASLLAKVSSSSITFLQTELKKLIIHGIKEPDVRIEHSLERISWSYPNIKSLQLYYENVYADRTVLITIHMPNLQLDELRINLFYETKRIIIRLNTDTDVKLYEGDEEGFRALGQEFDADDFNDIVGKDKSEDIVYFDITFQSSKELVIYFEAYPNFETKLVV